MHPFLIQYRGVVISSYAFFYGAGIAVAGLLFCVLLNHKGYSVRRGAVLYLFAGVAVILGGQLMYGIVRWQYVKNDVAGFLGLSAGGQILYGSMLAIIPVLWLLARICGVMPRHVFDAVAVSSPLGLAIGRIGCLCNGCCHGTVTSSSCGVSYPKTIDAQGQVIGTEPYLLHLSKGVIPFGANESLPIHPVQLYESVLMLVVFGVLLALWRRQRFEGRLAPLFILLYCGLRFALEFIRVQEPVLWGLTLAQYLSVGIAGGAVLWLALSKNARAQQVQSTEETPVSAGSSCG